MTIKACSVHTRLVLAALSAHRDVLCEHLADEEANILPLIEEHLTVVE